MIPVPILALEMLTVCICDELNLVLPRIHSPSDLGIGRPLISLLRMKEASADRKYECCTFYTGEPTDKLRIGQRGWTCVIDLTRS